MQFILENFYKNIKKSAKNGLLKVCIDFRKGKYNENTVACAAAFFGKSRHFATSGHKK